LLDETKLIGFSVHIISRFEFTKLSVSLNMFHKITNQDAFPRKF